jgi:NADH dehydrogenase
MTMNTTQNVVIIGGGFGGLHAAQALKDAPVHITLVDRRNFHLFQPLLYQWLPVRCRQPTLPRRCAMC